MVNMIEIKSIKLTPFTKMSATVHGILGFIIAVVFSIVVLILQAVGTIPDLGFNSIIGLGLPLIILLQIGAFFSTILVGFFSVLVYNILVPKLGGLKLEFDNDVVNKIPVIPFSLIISAIIAVWAFIMGLMLAAVITPMYSLISSMPNNMTSNITSAAGINLPSGAGFEAIFIVALIIGLPILVFVFGFIYSAIIAILYNYVVSRVAKISLKFESINGNLNELKNIPLLPNALVIGLISAIIGIIPSIIFKNYTEFIYNFVIYFAAVALIAYIYNFLAPKIGSIKVKLE